MNERIQFAKRISCLIFVGTMPFWPVISAIALIPLIALFVIFPGESPKGKSVSLLWFSGPFVAYIFSFFYAYDSTDAAMYLLRVLPMLVVPIILLRQDNESLPAQKALKTWFIYGTLLSSMFALVMSFFSYLRTGDIHVFTYYDLAENMRLHPTYYSLYALTAIVFLWGGSFRLGFRIFTTAFLILLIVLLQSRTAFFLLILTSLIFGITRWKSSVIRMWAYIALIITAAGIFIQYSNRVSDDLKRVLELDEPLIGTIEENGVTQRLWLWKEALQQISEKPLMGYGLRSQKILYRWNMHKKSLEQKHSPEYYRASWEVSRLNLHNQYLQILYEGGIFGVILVMVSFGMIFYGANRARNRSFLMAFAILLVMLATENILDRQMGIFYYSVFLPIFFKSKDKPLKYLIVKYSKFKSN